MPEYPNSGPVKITSDATIRALQPPASGRIDVFDRDVRGLVLRLSSSGVRSWSFVFRLQGKLRRLTLGRYPALSLREARQRARDARASVDRRVDPVEQRKTEERAAQENGFASLVDEFVERYAKVHQRQWKETERALKKNAVPLFQNRAIQSITRREIVDLLDRKYAAAPFASNQLRAHLSRMFKWLVEREVLDANPLGRCEAAAPRSSSAARADGR